VLGVPAFLIIAALAGYSVLRRSAAGGPPPIIASAESEPPDEEEATVQPVRPRALRTTWRPPPIDPGERASIAGRSSATPVATGEPAIDDRQHLREREIAIQAEMHRIPIKIYVTQWCPHCQRARVWLAANRYSFTAIDVEADAAARRTRDTLNSGHSVPTFDIDGVVLVGFSEGSVDRVLREQATRRLEP